MTTFVELILIILRGWKLTQLAENINHFPSRVIKESKSNSNILPVSTLSVANHHPFDNVGYKQKGVSSPVDIDSNKNIDSRNESNSKNYDDVEEMEVTEDLPIVQKVPQSVAKYKSSNQRKQRNYTNQPIGFRDDENPMNYLHVRLGHLSDAYIKKMFKHGMINFLPNYTYESIKSWSSTPCRWCLLAK
jgi:hypothetical protein